MRMRQKPWNKVQRREKFWIPHFQLHTAQENIVLSTAGNPQYIVFWDPFVEATEQSASFNFQARGLSRQKLHRVQGHIKMHAVWNSNVWPSGSPYLPPMAVVEYVWLVLDKAADTHDAGSFPATNMDPTALSTGDLFEILQRDDILRWGSVDVHRVNSYGEVLSGFTFTDTSGQLVSRASIPFPRIGKMGLDIQRGKALACIAKARALVDGLSGTAIDDGLESVALSVIVEPIYRFLVS